MPGSPRKQFACPHCGEMGTGEVTNPRVSADPIREYRRTYKCDQRRGGCGEAFTTVERVEVASFAHVLIGGRREGASSYDRSRLEANIDQRVPKTITDAERDLVVSHVEARMQQGLDHGRLGRRDDRGHIVVHIDTYIRLILEAFKQAGRRPNPGDRRERLKSAHIQYALAVLGQRNGVVRLKGAPEFLTWFRAEYPDLPQRPLPEVAGRPSLEWYPPLATRPTTIQTVVKNFRPDREASSMASSVDAADDPGIAYLPDVPSRRSTIRRRETVDFNPQKIRDVLALALTGRRGDHQARLVSDVFEWVMWGFVGQSVVRSSQISASIAEALRSIDDIAYLRWTTIGKELTVDQVQTEAELLIKYPSPLLAFKPDRAATLRPPISSARVASLEDQA